MPYHLQKNGEQWCVHKGDTGDDQGEVPGGCHPSRTKAVAHMRALYANVPDAQKAVRIDGEERMMLVADTPKARLLGLGGVEELPNVDGMLFVYERDVMFPFTASNMKFPIVMAFYSSQGDLLEYHTVVPGVPGVFPAQPYRYVVEMPSDRFTPGKLVV